MEEVIRCKCLRNLSGAVDEVLLHHRDRLVPSVSTRHDLRDLLLRVLGAYLRLVILHLLH